MDQKIMDEVYFDGIIKTAEETGKCDINDSGYSLKTGEQLTAEQPEYDDEDEYKNTRFQKTELYLYSDDGMIIMFHAVDLFKMVDNGEFGVLI